MNKKIKVIELFELIFNNKQISQKILYDNEEYVFNKSRLIDFLNDEVEILEDNTEEINIQKIEEIDEYLYQGSDLPNVKDGHCIKTNELIRAIKQLDRAINKLRKEKA